MPVFASFSIATIGKGPSFSNKPLPLFLTVHSPEPIARKNALARQSWPRLRTLPSERQAQTPHRRVDRTHCASAKPHWEPDYARGKSARGAFLHVLTGVPSPILPFSCELCRSSFPPSLPFLLLFLSLASHPSFTSSIFPQLFCRFTSIIREAGPRLQNTFHTSCQIVARSSLAAQSNASS
jgi:hypothetical protein